MKFIQTLTGLFFLFFCTLSYAQSTEFWGTTSNGGESNGGVIFKTDAEGKNLSIVKEFKSEYDGNSPHKTQLLEASNGKLYGLTVLGGKSDVGVLFEYDPKQSIYRKKFDFNLINSGHTPTGSLIEGSNGKLYGLTISGGDSSAGVLFEYDILSNVYSVKIDFNFRSTGAEPKGSLIEVNGILYGFTSRGGTNDAGTLFSYDYSSAKLTTLANFNPTTTGSSPEGTLNLASNGKLYGLCSAGGANGTGTLFEFDISNNTLELKANFHPYPFPNNPVGNLIEAKSNKLYGTAGNGGSNGSGGIFEYDMLKDTLKELTSFEWNGNPNDLHSSLTKLANGNVLGTMGFDQSWKNGFVYEYDLTKDTLIKRFQFDDTYKGRFPYSSLTLTKKGKLYGMTSQGGIENQGVIYELDTVNFNYKKVLDFGFSSAGKNASGALIHHENGKFYGSTVNGGKEGNGVLYEYDPNNDRYQVLYDFIGFATGISPQGSLLKASNGKLYGICNRGGSRSKGVIFEYDINAASLSIVHSFDDEVGNAEDPEFAFSYSLIEANGVLYGVTRFGGVYNKGTLFSYEISSGNFSKRVDFDGPILGSQPGGALTLASNGKIYGTTAAGAGNFSTNGKLFEFDPSLDTIIKKIDFQAFVPGEGPRGKLLEISNGKLIGTTFFGGANSSGILYEYDYLNDTLTQLADFNGFVSGFRPQGSIIEGSDGNLYGTTRFGGFNNKGTLFSYNPKTDSLSSQTSFAANGAAIPTEGLLEIDFCTTINTAVIYKDSTLRAKLNDASYQWLNCNNNYAMLNGETSRDFTPLDTGFYAVEIKKNGCVDTSECIPVINVGIKEVNALLQASLSPNPFDNNLSIKLNMPQALRINIYDIKGQLVYQSIEAKKSLEHQLNFSPKAGVYILQLISNDAVASYKIIKE